MGRRKSKSKLRKPKTQKWIPKAVASSSCPSPPPSPQPQPPAASPSPPPQSPPPPPPAASPPPPWTELPIDITANILQRLGAVDVLESAQRVCTTWRRVSQDPAMWRVIDMNHLDGAKVCRLAVDRSQGQLIDLRLDYDANDELLTYIVQRSSNLRRLTLKLCLNITGEGLVEAVKRLPNLEELHLIIMPSVQAANVEVIGISCPMLKSFTLNEPGCKYPARNKLMEGSNNMYALAVAKTIPNLRHLRLFANSMQNEGLQAILDGCPHLESLDIRQCFDLDLQGDLGKRCSKQIKQLKLPSDSISDIDWPLGYGSGFSPIYDSDDFYYDDYGYHDDFNDSDSDSDYDHGSAYDADDWFFSHNYF